MQLEHINLTWEFEFKSRRGTNLTNFYNCKFEVFCSWFASNFTIFLIKLCKPWDFSNDVKKLKFNKNNFFNSIYLIKIAPYIFFITHNFNQTTAVLFPSYRASKKKYFMLIFLIIYIMWIMLGKSFQFLSQCNNITHKFNKKRVIEETNVSVVEQQLIQKLLIGAIRIFYYG